MQKSSERNAAASGYAADLAETRFVSANGLKLAYRELGPASRTPLVLCMRLRGTMDEWDPAFLDLLSRRRRVYLFDSAGVGLSSGETPDRVPGMALIVVTLIEALGLDHVDLLGWSMGGYVATSVAFQRPDLVRKLVVAGSGPGGVPDSPPAPAKVWEIASKPVNDDEDFLYLFYPHTAEGRAAGQAQLARLGRRAEPAEPWVKAESVKAQINALTAFRGGDALYPRLSELSVPTLYANGMHDIMIHAYSSYAAAQRAPNAQLILYPHSGHGFLFQYYEQFASDVAQFLDR